MDKLKHPCFPQPENRGIAVWRYMDLPKFINLLDTRKLFLARVDKLKDAHEGSLTPDHAKANLRQALYFGPTIAGALEQDQKYRQKLRKRTFVSCWHLNEGESEAMWRLYCGCTEGIAIKTTYNKLAESIADPEMYIGLVTYIDYENGKQSFPTISTDSDWPPKYKYFYPFMHKRKSFEHEREARMIKTAWDDENNREIEEPGISIPWNLEQNIDSIYVNPYAADWYVDVVKTVVAKFGPKLQSPLHNKNKPYY